MTRLSSNLSDGTVTRTDLYVAGFWVLLGVLGIVIAGVLHVVVLGYLGPVAALVWGCYDFTRLARR